MVTVPGSCCGQRRWIGAVHAAVTTIAVVVTANHDWLDVVVALVLVAGAVRDVRWRASGEPGSVVGPATLTVE